MKSFLSRAIFAVILGLGLLIPRASAADGTPFKSKYAGFSIATAVDNNGDGWRVSLTQANGQGTFGNYALASTTEFEPVSPPPAEKKCPDEVWIVELSLLSSATVQTFADQSQAILIATGGWSCLDTSTGQYHGVFGGEYVGGTGRFEGATGDFTTTFSGVILDPVVGFETITGTVEGTVNRP